MDFDLKEPPAAAGSDPTQRLMLEWKAKYIAAMDVQAQMEADIEHLTGEKAQLQREAQRLKQQKASDEQELANVTKQLINGQSQYMEQMSSLSEEVSRLRTKNRALEDANGQLQERARISEDKFRQLEQEKDQEVQESQKALATQRASAGMGSGGASMLDQEIAALHERFKTEIKQLGETRDRLQEENDALQLLLAEKTITDDMHNMEISGSTLDTELAGFDNAEPSDLRFELQSAQNYIQALKLSLESLVQRLLENKEFEKVMEETIGHRKVSAFTERKRQAASLVEGPRLAPGDKAYWTNILSPRKKGSTRVFSMGVDDKIDDSMSDSSSRSRDSTLCGGDLVIPKRAATTNQTGLRKLSLV